MLNEHFLPFCGRYFVNQDNMHFSEHQFLALAAHCNHLKNVKNKNICAWVAP